MGRCANISRKIRYAENIILSRDEKYNSSQFREPHLSKQFSLTNRSTFFLSFFLAFRFSRVNWFVNDALPPPTPFQLEKTNQRPCLQFVNYFSRSI